ncbi:MAG: DUF1275 domain-containing protein [Bacteroidetes bacterium]|nr:DUF1275 domain-containing protein [Bacteroidota bacterium]
MFKHKGKARTFSHNLKIASLLSSVAGIVNVAGFFSVQKLTTNVTGHFAYFVDEIVKFNFSGSLFYFLFVFFFLLGSFFSSFLVEFISNRNERNIYIIPASFEVLILILLGLFGENFIVKYPNWMACVLLFSMGLQNSLVTSISNSIVRTTHLTGLFTDLGIELSQLFFYREAEQRFKLKRSIKLRLTIIASFFLGGFLGGIFYLRIQIKVLLVAAIILLTGLIYDSIKIRWILLRRKFRSY